MRNGGKQGMKNAVSSSGLLPGPCQLFICSGGVSFLPNLKGCCFMLWTRKGGIRGSVRKPERKGPFKSTHNGLTHKGNQRLPGPLKRLFHTAFNHQKSLRKSWYWGSSELVLLLFTWILPFPKSCFQLFPPESRVSSQDATAYMTFALLSAGSVAVFDIFFEAVGSLVLKTQIQNNNSCYLPVGFHYCLSRILLENNGIKCSLGGDTIRVVLFTFSVLGGLFVLLSV